jgi:hypothetical protein
VGTVTPRRCSDRSPFRRSGWWEARQYTSGGLDEHDAGAARIDRAEVSPQRVPRQLGDLASHLDAGGASADADEREPRVPCGCVRLCLGGLEGAARRRLRTESALSSDLTSAACARHSSWAKYEYCDPPATISVS